MPVTHSGLPLAYTSGLGVGGTLALPHRLDLPNVALGDFRSFNAVPAEGVHVQVQLEVALLHTQLESKLSTLPTPFGSNASSGVFKQMAQLRRPTGMLA